MTATEVRFVEVYKAYHKFVYAFCRRRLPVDRVEDVVAETFLVAWRRVGEIPEGDAALRWLYAVAYRVVGHQWRSASRRRRLDRKLFSIAVEPATPPDDFIVVREESKQILEAASRLKRSDRELLTMAVWDDLSHSDIGEILNISPAAVKQRLHEARKKLTREYNRLDKRHHSAPAARKGGAL